MSLKKFDLAKNLGLKINGQRKAAAIPGRFAQESAEVLDKRERRQRDAAAGLVPFACKLPLSLARELHDRAAQHPGGLNALMAQLLRQGLDSLPPAQTPPAAS